MYDVIIIGAGPAGISASLYTQRANLKTLIIYQESSSLRKATQVDNYYGFAHGVKGRELYETGIEQAKNIGVSLRQEEVIKIEMKLDGFTIATSQGEYVAKAVILAVGNEKKPSHIKGSQELDGKGISYCAICDGFFYRDREVAVIGSGKFALSETNDLLNIAKNITILTNGEPAPEFRAENVDIVTKPIASIEGEERVREVRFEDGSSLPTEGVFIAQGLAGSMELAKKIGILTKGNNIAVGENMETNVPGIYACGDCTGGLLQVSKAVYEGAKAGLGVVRFLKQ